ncbi:MAG: ABC transporter substrate-binding protein, partial [Chloroflexi bacterium]|nr:ABC transporter substrate-binding protein [Chloroflexota bacterium]
MIKSRISIFTSALIAIILILTTLPGCVISANKYDLNLWDSGPLTLDPAISSEMSSHIYVMQIFSGLVKFDAQLKPVPDIAESWDISADGKTYTFYLRKEAKFHDGRPVTSTDIKYSLERTCDPATGSQTASTYLSDIIGVQDVLSGKSKDLAGVQVIDASTLKITIDAPTAYFLSKMAYPTAFVVDKKNVESGTDWWQKPKEISKEYIDRAQDPAGPFANQLHIFPEFSLQYIGFNTSKPPFDDPLVRQAFCYAVDKGRIIKLIQKDMATKAEGIIPVDMPGYNKDVKGLDFDPAKAKELLAKSKYGSAANLPPIILTTGGYGGVDVADYLGAILQDWKQN